MSDDEVVQPGVGGLPLVGARLPAVGEEGPHPRADDVEVRLPDGREHRRLVPAKIGNQDLDTPFSSNCVIPRRNCWDRERSTGRTTAKYSGVKVGFGGKTAAF
ncbi:hypothetical protein [Streptomyces sp. UG1]|uniref:hypothetical protein n=1 Tax=Streptomyces sp. UG1 TaxID=3417652 RepID=UPI003CEE6D80